MTNKETQRFVVTPKFKIKLGERVIVDGKKSIKIKHGKEFETIPISELVELLYETA